MHLSYEILNLARRVNKKYLDLWFFMKPGPSFRNSVVSPKTGHPMVPGGNPFFLYLTSFHLSKAILKRQSPQNTPTITTKLAINFSLKAPTTREMEVDREREM